MRQYYDLIFYEPLGAKQYYDFVFKHATGSKLMEVACGTGDMMYMLSDDFDVFGFDVDASMIQEAKDKYPSLENRFEVGDFYSYRSSDTFDTAFCIGDSSNYVEDEAGLQKLVDTLTSLSDHVIIDCHHPSRLQEFEEPYFEEDIVDGFEYAYQIETVNDHLVHVINFLNGTYETITQWVFDPNLLIAMLKNKGYRVDVYTDHTQLGFLEEGEKIVLDAVKEKQ